MSEEINYKIDNCITDLDTLICLDKRAIKDLENNTHEIEQQEVLTIIREFIRLRNDYNKEKEKNVKYEKTILQDTSYSMITRLEMKLKYDIEQINKKLTSDEYINDYRVARLKGIRTKCKELLELLEERNK